MPIRADTRTAPHRGLQASVVLATWVEASLTNAHHGRPAFLHLQRIAPVFTTLWPDDLSRAADAAPRWLSHGYLAPGNVTLLTGQWKCGKTTLLAALLSRLGTVGTLAGLPLAVGKAVVVTEESAQHWHRRGEQFRFGRHLCWLCRPFRSKPRPAEWLALIDHLGCLHADHGLDLVVIDPLASFLPGRSENDASLMLESLLPLQRLTARGVAVLVAHHPSKKAAPAGQRARGSGAMSGHADILIEVDWHAAPTEADRRRRLVAFSRHAETPRQLVIELSADGTDYRSLGTVAELEFEERWRQLRPILEGATSKLTRRALLARWPRDERHPDPVTLWRWLDRAVAQGLLLRDGTGRKSDPFRFWLPEKDEAFSNDFNAVLERMMRENMERYRGARSG